MEAYYYNDPRIREFINQIMDSVFSASLLTGIDSEVELEKGCQSVVELISLLQAIPTVPSEFLEDMVKQLIEQQLPDERVINSSPSFQPTMDRLLCEGLLKAQANTQIYADALALAEKQAQTDALTLDETLAEVLDSADKQAEVDALVLPEVITYAETPTTANAQGIAVAAAATATEAETATEATAESNPEADSKTSLPLQGPEQANHLYRALNILFPKSTVNWNKSLLGRTFLAQVDDILICLADSDNPCDPEMYHNDGWKVLVCNTEDLPFPRRLKRGIRQIQRSSSKVKA